MAKKIVLAILLILLFLMGGVFGFAIGYRSGAKAMAEYGIALVEKVKIDNFRIELNQTKIDKLVDQLQNMSDTLNQRVQNTMNISLT